ncbi:MAG: hypothetical protein LBH74_00715 [Nitrososphaerota archaeon]|jgi:hypothetical protein|nr:hypothetical protein [Nitrososphaerota archaeon]
METEKDKDGAEVIVVSLQPVEGPIETSQIEPCFISQVESAFAKHLPAGADVDTFVEKIVDAFLSSPPAEI